MINEEYEGSFKDLVFWYMDHQETMDKIKDKLDFRFYEVVKRFIKVERIEGYRDCFPSDSSRVCFYWEIKSGDVCVDWEENWNYGGHDSGYFVFPAKFIYDEQALLNHEEKRRLEKQDIEEKRKLKDIAEKKEQLEKLKKELDMFSS